MNRKINLITVIIYGIISSVLLSLAGPFMVTVTLLDLVLGLPLEILILILIDKGVEKYKQIRDAKLI